MAIQDPLTGLIIGSCFRVANELGNGFVEKAYENALAHELRKAKVKVVQQQGIEVYYNGVVTRRVPLRGFRLSMSSFLPAPAFRAHRSAFCPRLQSAGSLRGGSKG
ncbi:GxxExxY protein [Geothrix sp. 21YS21S-2]|uniref:GxxExxY protein n=1 Tax=Geothrix sp. 21YS21S-2 TaxID=3068893 RepID=UPI0027B9636D|nr:GxxExxY protein [Geothrix sp. 21YS21S-2]